MSTPKYTVKISPRARHVRFRVTAADGLTVVIPKGFRQSRIPALLAEKQAWVDKAVREVLEHAPPPLAPDWVPGRLKLPALNESWALRYKPGQPGYNVATDHARHSLTLKGDVLDQDVVFELLRQWLKTRAQETLAPMAFRLADEFGLPITRVTIRNQRSRWGSCSARKTLSLNLKLLLINPELARHVIVHELCHTRHLNHSPRFWALLCRFEPDYLQLDKQLNGAWKSLPLWV